MNDTLVQVFSHTDGDTLTQDTLHRINMDFGAPYHKLLPIGKETYHGNYYLAHIPEGRPLVPLYKHLYMEQVYDHIDVNYTSNGRGPKYQFIIHPNGIASSITMVYSGQDSLYVDPSGALVVEGSVGSLRHPKAKAYEMDVNGNMTLLPWQPAYNVTGSVVGFSQIGSYNPSRRLVIVESNGTPTSVATANGNLEWCTFFGGTDDDWILDMVNSPQNDLFVGGKTLSSNFASILGISISSQNAGLRDGLVAAFNSADQLSWFTYLGGSMDDVIQSIAFNSGAGRTGFFS